MKIPLISVFTFALSLATAAADQCKYKGHSWSVGDTYAPPGECSLLTCNAENEFSAKTCPDIVVPGCPIIEQAKSRAFPDCCPDLDRCEKSKGK